MSGTIYGELPRKKKFSMWSVTALFFTPLNQNLRLVVFKFSHVVFQLNTNVNKKEQFVDITAVYEVTCD